MKKLFSILLITALSLTTAEAQTTLNSQETVRVENEIKTATSKLATISSQFVQNKHVSGMTKDLTCQGLFMYKKSGKIRFDYTTPMKYTMIVNGDKMNMGGKTITAKSGMKEMLTMLEACMTGNMEPLKAKYNLVYTQTDKSYSIKITPKTKNNFVEELIVTLNKSDKLVTKVKMVEPVKSGKKGNDYTEYTFSNTKKDTALDDKKFEVK